jgi:hypothetical protein
MLSVVVPLQDLPSPWHECSVNASSVCWVNPLLIHGETDEPGMVPAHSICSLPGRDDYNTGNLVQI